MFQTMVSSLLLELSRDLPWWMWKGAWLCNAKAQEWKGTHKESFRRPPFHPDMALNTLGTASSVGFSAAGIYSYRLLPRSPWAVWGNNFIIQTISRLWSLVGGYGPAQAEVNDKIVCVVDLSVFVTPLPYGAQQSGEHSIGL